MTKKILIINGPNLEMLGKRDKSKYGDFSLDNLMTMLSDEASKLGCEVEFFQNNIEGEIINKINSLDDSYDGIIINPGGLTHTSVSLHDSLEIKQFPKIEVHISNIYKREEFRHKSLISQTVNGVICGFGINSYKLALKGIKNILDGN